MPSASAYAECSHQSLRPWSRRKRRTRVAGRIGGGGAEGYDGSRPSFTFDGFCKGLRLCRVYSARGPPARRVRVRRYRLDTLLTRTTAALGLGLFGSLACCAEGRPAGAPLAASPAAPSAPVAQGAAPAPSAASAFPYPAHPARRSGRRAARRPGARSVPVARGRSERRREEVGRRPERRDPRLHRGAAGARRARRALQGALYVESAGTPRLVGNRLFYPRRDAGKEKATIYWRARNPGHPETWRAGARPARPERVVERRERVARRVERLVRRQEGRLHREGEQLGRGDALRDGRRHRQEERRRCHRGREVRLAVVDPPSDAFYYTWLPAASGSVPRPTARLRRGAPAHPRDRSGKDKIVHEKTGDPKTFVSAGIGKDGRWLIATIEHGWTSTDVYFQDLRSPKPEWQAARRRGRRPLRRDRRRRPLLRVDQRGRLAVPRLPRGPRAPRARPVERDRRGASGRDPRGRERRGPSPVARVPEGRRQSPRAPRRRREARPRDRAPDARVGVGPERRGRRRRRVLLVQLVHVPDRDLRDERQERRPRRPSTSSRSRWTLRSTWSSSSSRRARTGRGFRSSSFTRTTRRRTGNTPAMLYGYGGFQAAQTPVVLLVDLPVARERRQSGRSPTSAAAASTARSGTGRACATRSSTSSTTTSPSPRSS